MLLIMIVGEHWLTRGIPAQTNRHSGGVFAPHCIIRTRSGDRVDIPVQAFPVALEETEVRFERGISGSYPHNLLVSAADLIWQKEDV